MTPYQTEIDKSIQRMNIIWRNAPSPYHKYHSLNCICDFCFQKKFSTSCRVFHTINGFKGVTDVRDTKIGGYETYIKDHIIVCESCRYRLDKNWVSCFCKKEEIICH